MKVKAALLLLCCLAVFAQADDSVKHLKRQARGGNTEAMLKLGSIYIEGTLATQDIAAGIEWWEKAASAGNVTAMEQLGRFYEARSKKDGADVDIEMYKAVNWYGHAAPAGSSFARKRMDKISLRYSKNYWKTQADVGELAAMLKLAKGYLIGKEVPKNQELSLSYWRTAFLKDRAVTQKAVEQLEPAAAEPVWKMLESVYRIKRPGAVMPKPLADKKKKTREQEVAVAPEKADSQSSVEVWPTRVGSVIGERLPGSSESGNAASMSANQGIESLPVWKAAQKGDASAQNAVGEMYELGQHVAQNTEVAAQWYTQAAERGNADALLNLGLLCMKRQRSAVEAAEGALWFVAAAKQGNECALRNLRRFCEAWAGPVSRNGTVYFSPGSKVESVYQAAGKLGIAEAYLTLGDYYAFGSHSAVSKELRDACYAAAVKAGSRDATARYFAAGHLAKENKTAAASEYASLAAAGHTLAQYRLGMCYEYGLGVPVNNTTAKEWYERAATRMPEACLQMARFYALGKGCRRNPSRCVSFLRKALELIPPSADTQDDAYRGQALKSRIKSLLYACYAADFGVHKGADDWTFHAQQRENMSSLQLILLTEGGEENHRLIDSADSTMDADAPKWKKVSQRPTAVAEAAAYAAWHNMLHRMANAALLPLRLVRDSWGALPPSAFHFSAMEPFSRESVLFGRERFLRISAQGSLPVTVEWEDPKTMRK